eukprot:CAMPEP_0180511102 /NCGR_PEP_ID=MMETSP1036_2-20121128/50793_1 /TAXON_ID=632150 /ORGANISM="Azadinium spinosum, Strain 3D9" /LENGTH=95 /DNA_ID=CAMNT_0022521987 /DNA_START=9 /DNA_END=293 /DNA_ORIENTATION=+
MDEANVLSPRAEFAATVACNEEAAASETARCKAAVARARSAEESQRALLVHSSEALEAEARRADACEAWCVERCEAAESAEAAEVARCAQLTKRL